MKRLDAAFDIANECDNRREREVTEQTSAFWQYINDYDKTEIVGQNNYYKIKQLLLDM